MTDLVKYDFQKLPIGLQKYAKLRVGEPPFKKMQEREQKRACLAIVTRAHASNGTKGTEESVLTFQTMELMSCLNEKYGELTIKEIEQAFEFGIAGETGPYMGLYKKTYYQFLKHYYERPERSQAMMEFLKLNEPKPTELSPQEKLRKDKQALIWYFGEYKKSGKLGSGSYAMYQSLWDLGFLKFSAEEKRSIREKVEKEYTQELELSRKKQRISANQLAELLLTFETNPTVKGNLRKEALKRFFDQLIKEGKELESIIE